MNQAISLPSIREVSLFHGRPLTDQERSKERREVSINMQGIDWTDLERLSLRAGLDIPKYAAEVLTAFIASHRLPKVSKETIRRGIIAPCKPLSGLRRGPGKPSFKGCNACDSPRGEYNSNCPLCKRRRSKQLSQKSLRNGTRKVLGRGRPGKDRSDRFTPVRPGSLSLTGSLPSRSAAK